MICPRCKKEIDNSDNFCRFCGERQGECTAWYYTLWGVWVLFLLIGPFCLWFLYKSPTKNKTAKFINAIILTGLSVAMCYQFYISLKKISDFYSQLVSNSLF